MMRLSPLKSGDTIGLAAPASAVPTERVKQSVDYFESKGYNVFSAPNADRAEDDAILNTLAGPDSARTSALNEMFANPDIKAVCCLTGGYGVTRILRDIDFSLLKQNPKIICGFSDTTALHMAIYRETGLSSFHSPNMDSHPLDPDAEAVWLNMLQGNAVEFDGDYASRFMSGGKLPHVWKPGKAQGVLIGGNLTLVAALAGTPWAAPQDRDVILFLEDIGEFAYRVDVMLLQLMQSGAFRRVKGLVLGQFTKRKQQTKEAPDLMQRVLKAFCAQLDIPIVMNFPIGHVKKNFTVAHGARVEFNADEVSIRYLNPVIS